MHYPLCILVDISIIAEDKPDNVLARERAIASLAMYKGVEYDYLSTPDSLWPELPMEVLGRDEPARLLELLEEYRQHPLRNAKYWWEMALEESRKISQESADLFFSSKGSMASTDQAQITLNVDGLAYAFRIEPPGSEYHFLSCLTYAMSAAAGDFKCDSGFYCDFDSSTKIHSDTMVRVHEYPGWFALVFFDIHC